MLFISHATADDEIVNRLHDALTAAGLDVWADHKHDVRPGIMLGDDWDRAIEQAVKDADRGLFVMSRTSVNSNYCRAEWHRLLSANKRLYLAKIDDVPDADIPLRLGIIQYADLHKDFDKGLELLVQAIIKQQALNPESQFTGVARRISGRFPHSQLALTLIGRKKDLAAITAMLTQTDRRLAAIIGMGGVGKTRLAAEIAMLAEDFSDGVIWHYLESHTTPDDLTQLIRDHLQVAPQIENSGVWQELAKRKVLLILDNAEACPDPAAYARLINELDTSGGTRILMTSRNEWREIFQSRRHELRPPDPAAAVEILGKMIEQHPPKFSLKNHTHELARAARHHPRLMQYAVRWADKFPPERVLEILGDLKGRSAEAALEDMVGRTVAQVRAQKNGEAAIAALRRLAVCRGGFTYEAAAALIDDTEDLDLLTTWNLVAIDGDTARYEIDPLVIADVGEDATAQPTHYEFYGALARRHDQKKDYLGLDVESQNLAAAFEWTLEAGESAKARWLFNTCTDFLANRMRFGQRMAWAHRVEAALKEQSDKELWANFQISLGNVYQNQPTGNRRDNWQQAIICYEVALGHFTAEAAPSDCATTQNQLGETYRKLAEVEDKRGNLHRAIACFEAALAYFTMEAAPSDYGMTQDYLGGAYRKLAEVEDKRGNLHRAIACFEAALKYWMVEDTPSDYAKMQNNLGASLRKLAEVEDKRGNLHRAIEHFEAALERWTVKATPYYYAMAQSNLGNTYRDLATIEDAATNYQRAVTAYQNALQIRTPETFPNDFIHTQNNLAHVYHAIGNLAAAALCWCEAAQIAALIGNNEDAAKFTEWAEEAEARARE